MSEQTLLKEDQKVIVFRLENEEYGAYVHQVKSIEKMQKITRIPNASPFIKGVMNLRGMIIPVIDLKERFEIEVTPYTDSTRIVIISIEEMEVGFIVDAAYDVLDIPVDKIDLPPELFDEPKSKYIQGIAKIDDRLLMLLHMDKVLQFSDIDELQTIKKKNIE